MEDVEVRLNSGSIEVDDTSTYIFTVSNKQITTTNKDKTQVQRPKKQIYEIPTFENKKIVLNVKNGNVYIDDNSIDKSEDLGLLRNDGNTSVTPAIINPNLTFFHCENNEKDEILNSSDGVVLFSHVLFNELEQFFSIEGKTLNFKYDVTVKDSLNFDILQDFKILIENNQISDPLKSTTPVIPIAQKVFTSTLEAENKAKLNHLTFKTEDEEKIDMSKKMSKTTLLMIIILPIIFIIIISMLMVIVYKNRKSK